MQPLQLLSTLRAIADDTVAAAQRQEFKSTFIFQLHNDKLKNISQRIGGDVQLNRAVKAKLLREVNKMYLTGRNASDYNLLQKEAKENAAKLSSAIDFMKR